MPYVHIDKQTNEVRPLEVLKVFLTLLKYRLTTYIQPLAERN